MYLKAVDFNSAVGLKARPANMFTMVAEVFESNIWVQFGDRRVNGKSLLDILTLKISSGDSIWIIADGIDEQSAVNALKELIESDFSNEKLTKFTMNNDSKNKSINHQINVDYLTCFFRHSKFDYLSDDIVEKGSVKKFLIYKNSEIEKNVNPFTFPSVYISKEFAGITEIAILELSEGAKIKKHFHKDDNEIYYNPITHEFSYCLMGDSHELENKAKSKKLVVISIKFIGKKDDFGKIFPLFV